MMIRLTLPTRQPLLALFLLLFPMCVSAQGVDIRGIVSDSSTSEKLPFANIVLLGTNKGAASNINGFYLIPNILPGEYEISFSSVGYAKKVQKVFVGISGPVVVNAALASTTVEMGEVVVTEAGKRELKEINTSIHVLDQREMKLVPVTIQEDVFRSIQVLPGIVSTSRS